MYVPSWPTLSPLYFLPGGPVNGIPFPLSAANGTYFYLARYGIYSLFLALGFRKGDTVLVPDYHHGNEVRAIRAAGAAIRFYPINRRLEPDLDALTRLCRDHPRALYVIHFLGWPQPIEELAALCREREMILIEDCALALFSETGGRPLGSFGDYAIYCLYKTLPVPNGGLLVQNRHVLEELTKLELKPPGMTSVSARSSELLLEWFRSRADSLGKSLFWLKAAAGRGLDRLQVARLPVGDNGFDVAGANVGMSPLCRGLFKRFGYESIPRRRRENFRLLRDKLAGEASPLLEDLKEGVCPLFFPILVPDKHAAAQALWRRGISTVEFWNYGDPEATGNGFSDAQFLRKHVLELPIHQDITPRQVEYMAEQVLSLKLHL